MVYAPPLKIPQPRPLFSEPIGFSEVTDLGAIQRSIAREPMLLPHCGYVKDFLDFQERGVNEKYIPALVREGCYVACLAAINANPLMLQYVPYQTPHLCKMAFMQNVHLVPLLMTFVKDEALRAKLFTLYGS